MAETPPTPDRRTDDPKLVAMSKRIDDIVIRQTAIADAVTANTDITKRIEQSTSGLVDAWEAISGGLKVLNWLGKVAKWVTIIATAVTAVGTAIYLFAHGGTPQP